MHLIRELKKTLVFINVTTCRNRTLVANKFIAIVAISNCALIFLLCGKWAFCQHVYSPFRSPSKNGNSIRTIEEATRLSSYL